MSVLDHIFLGGTLYALTIFILVKGVGDVRLKGGGIMTMFILFFTLINGTGSLTYLIEGNKVLAVPFWWANILCMFVAVFAAGLTNLICKTRHGELAQFIYQSGKSPYKSDISFVLMLGAVMTGLFLFFLTQVRITEWPFLKMLMGENPVRLIELRKRSFGPYMGSPFWYLFALCRTYYMPVTFVAILLCWKHFSATSKTVALGILGIIFIFQSWSSAKTPTAMLILLCLFTYLTNTSSILQERIIGQKEQLKRIGILLLIVAAALAYPTFIYSMKAFGEDQSLWYILFNGVFHRILFVPVELSYQAFMVFPEKVDFLGIRDVTKLAILLGLEPVGLSTLMSKVLWGSDFNAPPSAIGNLWAQGGWTGVIIGSILIGITFQSLQIWIVRYLPRTTITFGLFIYLYYSAYRLCFTSFHGMFMSEGVVFTLITGGIYLYYYQSVVSKKAGRSLA